MSPSSPVRSHGVDQPADGAGGGLLSAQELLAGAQLVHEVELPAMVLYPGQPEAPSARRTVRLRPLRIATLALIAKAAQDDPALVPLLMCKESLVAPALGLDQLRQLHAGLVQYLVGAINRISGFAPDGSAVQAVVESPIGEAHLLLARHYGWTPSQVAELTPGQLAVYLAGLAPRDAPQADGGGAG